VRGPHRHMADPYFAFIARCDCRDCRREREQAGKLRPRDRRLRDRERADEDAARVTGHR
jgi:hypothetical protein